VTPFALSVEKLIVDKVHELVRQAKAGSKEGKRM
jgi:hypothetical protein